MVRASSNGKPARGALGVETLPASMGELAPRLNREGFGGGEVVGQFYASHEFLLVSLAGFVAEVLAEGDGCVVVS